MTPEKYIIVEGKTDQERLKQVLDENEPVRIIATNGTLSDEKLEELIFLLQHEEVFILVDADESGNRLRRQLQRELPNARHLYTRKMYREVSSTPLEYLGKILSDAHFEIKAEYFPGTESF